MTQLLADVISREANMATAGYYEHGGAPKKGKAYRVKNGKRKYGIDDANGQSRNLVAPMKDKKVSSAAQALAKKGK